MQPVASRGQRRGLDRVRDMLRVGGVALITVGRGIARAWPNLRAIPSAVASWPARTVALTRRWFPEREFIMRAEGRVRFIRLSTRLQATIAGSIAGAIALWLGVVLWVLIGSLFTSRVADLTAREAAVASAESRVARYRANLGAVAADLQKRQEFIERAVQGSLGPIPDSVSRGAPSDSSGEAAKTARKISSVLPETRGLAQVEARQLAFVERLTRYADARSALANGTIRKVGLNPDKVAAAGHDAQGGPLIRLATGPGQSIDPRFGRLAASLARMNTMNDSLARIPNTLPASLSSMSSGFGFRADPFEGGAAFHPGLDFRAPIGAPIYAAAAGTVISAGRRQGYGNCVEIGHGDGLVTRYAHMSRIMARVGQGVTAGTRIGSIGSTGRSTGPHLHFEVRINDRPVNPRPFLEAMSHVFQENPGRQPVAHAQSIGR